MRGLDYLLPVHHDWRDSRQHLDRIGTFQVSGLGENHIGVPGGVAHLDIDHSNEVHLLQHLKRARLTGQGIHRVLLVNHPRLHRIGCAGNHVLAQL